MSTEQQAQTSAAAATDAAASPLLSQVIAATPANLRDIEWEGNRMGVGNLVAALLEEVNKGTVTVQKDVVRTVKGAIAQIDEVVSKQLSAIMHSAEFQKL